MQRLYEKYDSLKSTPLMRLVCASILFSLTKETFLSTRFQSQIFWKALNNVLALFGSEHRSLESNV